MSETVDSEVGRFYLTEVEPVLLDRTLQFSTSVEVRLRIVSSLVSYSPVFPENRAQDFSDILHECSLL